jgi:hypothetical protein
MLRSITAQLGCRDGDVGSREELDPTYSRADEVIE